MMTEWLDCAQPFHRYDDQISALTRQLRVKDAEYEALQQQYESDRKNMRALAGGITSFHSTLKPPDCLCQMNTLGALQARLFGRARMHI